MNTIRRIRVLIAEDSKVNQKLLTGLLVDDPGFEIIGIVNNGSEAVEFVAKNKPDVISMDITMPLMDGYEATRQIMKRTPVPIVIVSSLFNVSDVKMMLKILEVGALTILPKPHGPGHPNYLQSAATYRNTLKMMSEVKVKVLSGPGPGPGVPAMVEKQPVSIPATRTTEFVSSGHPGNYKIIAIGASAGGPQIIQYILKSLPLSLPVPVMIVQHIDGTFAEGYIDWLRLTSKLPLHTAFHGERMLPGHAYLPPGDYHLGVLSPGCAAVTKAPAERGLRPAVRVLFTDVMNIYGRSAIGIILSGMGADGAAELKLLRDRGAYTIAQDAQSSVVHGMPGEAIKMGGAIAILPPDAIVKEIVRLTQNSR